MRSSGGCGRRGLAHRDLKPAYLLGVQDLRRALAVIFGVGLLAIPVTVGIAILRHRLYDIDLLINRTLIYGLVTVTLGLGYAATALLVGTLFGRGSSLTAATATLVVAAAFQPVRRRVQDAVDRRFNRHKYDAAKTIAAFSARLRRQVDLDALTAELTTVGRPDHAAEQLPAVVAAHGAGHAGVRGRDRRRRPPARQDPAAR